MQSLACLSLLILCISVNRQFLEMDDLNIVFNCKTRKNASHSVIIILGKSKTRSGGFKCIRKKDVEELEQNTGKKRLTVQ